MYTPLQVHSVEVLGYGKGRESLYSYCLHCRSEGPRCCLHCRSEGPASILRYCLHCRSEGPASLRYCLHCNWSEEATGGDPVRGNVRPAWRLMITASLHYCPLMLTPAPRGARVRGGGRRVSSRLAQLDQLTQRRLLPEAGGAQASWVRIPYCSEKHN